MQTTMVAVVFMLSVFSASSATAQSPLPTAAEPLAVDTRVRANVGDRGKNRIVGKVASFEGDTLRIVEARTGNVVVLAIGDIRRLETRQGSQRRTLTGLGYGLVGGAAAGALVGVVGYEKCDRDGSGLTDCFRKPASSGEAAAASGIVGAGVGLVAGGIIGTLIQTSTWVPTNLAVATSIGTLKSIAIAPSGGGVTIGVRMEF